MGPHLRPVAWRVRPVVRRRHAQHLLQLPGPSRRSRPRRPAGADLRQPDDQHVRTFTYADLLDRTCRLAGALAALGVTKGDRVVIYMPMVPEAAVAMLATARLGAVHSVVFGGFAAAELSTRIADAKPKVIISASCGLEPGRVIKYKPLLDAAIALSPHKPDACLILQRPQVEAPLIAGPRSRLQRRGQRRGPARLRSGPGNRPAVCALYLGHHRQTQGRRPRQRRPRRGAVELHADDLRPRCRRRLVDRIRCRLGRRPQLHRVRARCCAAAPA